jgi:hypothetical protein
MVSSCTGANAKEEFDDPEPSRPAAPAFLRPVFFTFFLFFVGGVVGESKAGFSAVGKGGSESVDAQRGGGRIVRSGESLIDSGMAMGVGGGACTGAGITAMGKGGGGPAGLGLDGRLVLDDDESSAGSSCGVKGVLGEASSSESDPSSTEGRVFCAQPVVNNDGRDCAPSSLILVTRFPSIGRRPLLMISSPEAPSSSEEARYEFWLDGEDGMIDGDDSDIFGLPGLSFLARFFSIFISFCKNDSSSSSFSYIMLRISLPVALIQVLFLTSVAKRGRHRRRLKPT